MRTLKARPVDLIDADRAAMLALPPVPPQLGWRNQIRLGRDYYVRVDTSDYSVDPTAIGRIVDRHRRPGTGPGPPGGRLVADHARVWARGMTVTDPAHVDTAPAAARAVHGQPRAVADDELVRDLADYDRAFGLDGDRRAGRLMAATKNPQSSTSRSSRSTYLAAALKAPRITEAAARLADQARDAGLDP